MALTLSGFGIHSFYAGRKRTALGHLGLEAGQSIHCSRNHANASRNSSFEGLT
jgi:hypothetical protein